MQDSPIVSLRSANIYQGKSLVLNDVNLHVNKGEFVYMIGKTGSGKSSLLKTLYGDLYLTEGEGEVAGFDLKKLKWQTVPQLRRNLGIVFQDFRLLTDRNVNDNLEFVLKATGWTDKILIKEKIDHVLTKVGLKNKGFKMPYEMSGGEQQRVDIARALLNNPKLILADEPTGNLDPDTRDEIMQLLFNICRDYHTAFIMARIVRIEQGSVREITVAGM
jgi:cell division transport system ATP-binding protein